MLKFPNWLENSGSIYAVLIDQNGKYSYVNNNFRNRFSFLADHLIGLNYIESIHPDDVEACTTAAHQCLADASLTRSVHIRKPDGAGGYFHTDWEFTRVDDEHGNIIGIMSIGFDVSPRQFLLEQLTLKEANLSAVINSTPDVLLFIDKIGRIKALNSTAQKFAKNFLKNELKIGENFFETVPESMQHDLMKGMSIALHGDFCKMEMNLFDVSLSTTWFEFSFNPVNVRGEILGFTLNGRNIDDRKLTELKILEQNDRLKNIAYEHTHELRGPLSTMMGLLNQLEEFKLKLTDREKEKYLADLSLLAEGIDTVIRRIVKEAEI